MHSKDVIEQNKKVYDIIAPLFAATRQYIWDDFKPFEKYITPNQKVLDLGCGTGRLYQFFAKFQPSEDSQGKGIQYIGMDQSEGQLHIAKNDFPNNTYILGEMTELPFENNSFDSIFCVAVFHHLPDEETRNKSLTEMKRVLKPGGRVFMTNWNLYSDSAQKTVAKGKWEQRDGEFRVPWMNPQGEVLGERFYYGFTPEYVQQLTEEMGFDVEENYYSKKGEKSSKEEGHNIVTILKNT